MKLTREIAERILAVLKNTEAPSVYWAEEAIESYDFDSPSRDTPYIGLGEWRLYPNTEGGINLRYNYFLRGKNEDTVKKVINACREHGIEFDYSDLS